MTGPGSSSSIKPAGNETSANLPANDIYWHIATRYCHNIGDVPNENSCVKSQQPKSAQSGTQRALLRPMHSPCHALRTVYIPRFW